MRTIIYKSVIVITVFLLLYTKLQAQLINWGNDLKQSRHLLHFNTGTEYGFTVGMGYHHLIPIKRFPLWVGGEISVPLGNLLADDFKIGIGAKVRIATLNHFKISASIQGISRRYHNELVTLYNFGSVFVGTIGFYQKKWFLGVEGGFDKAIVTNFKHSEWYKKNIYDKVQDGWYQPATGGNFYYVLQGGVSSKKFDFTLKAGKFIQQDFTFHPLLPVYGQVGINYRF